MNNRDPILPQILVWTFVLELVTVILKFGFGFSATRDTASTIGVLTQGVRIHHSYIGVLMLPLAVWLWPRKRGLAEVLLIIGLSLVLSDLCHHLLVLWIFTGSPQFDLFY